MGTGGGREGRREGPVAIATREGAGAVAMVTHRCRGRGAGGSQPCGAASAPGARRFRCIPETPSPPPPPRTATVPGTLTSGQAMGGSSGPVLSSRRLTSGQLCPYFRSGSRTLPVQRSQSSQHFRPANTPPLRPASGPSPFPPRLLTFTSGSFSATAGGGVGVGWEPGRPGWEPEHTGSAPALYRPNSLQEERRRMQGQTPPPAPARQKPRISFFFLFIGRPLSKPRRAAAVLGPGRGLETIKKHKKRETEHASPPPIGPCPSCAPPSPVTAAGSGQCREGGCCQRGLQQQR